MALESTRRTHGSRSIVEMLEMAHVPKSRLKMKPVTKWQRLSRARDGPRVESDLQQVRSAFYHHTLDLQSRSD